MDSSVRETYTNSSGTFQIMINDDDSQIGADQVVIETGATLVYLSVHLSYQAN